MATIDSFTPAMKRIYRDVNIATTTYENRPLLGLLQKFEGFGGEAMPVVTEFGNPQGVGAVFATAQSNVTDGKRKRFLLTRIAKHSLAHVDSETAAATMNDKYAFVAALKREVDAAMKSLSDTLESDGFRSGTGALGRVSAGSTVSTSTITLSDINDVTNFESGMSLVSSDSDGGALHNSGAAEVLAAVNRSTGVLTSTSAAWNTTISSIGTTDYLYRQGDAANGGSNVCVSGLAAWGPDISSSIPSASFFGVDRSVDSRLVFTYHDGSTDSVEEALIDAAVKTDREGGEPNVCLINHVQFRRLEKQLGSKKEYSETNALGAKGTMANIGYKGFAVHAGSVTMNVIPANKCQSDIAWGLDTSCITWNSLGPLTRFDDTDGNRILRRASASGVEARLVSWSQIGVKAPCYNFRCKLPSA